LRVARADVWANAEVLARARSQSAAAFAAGCDELARLTIRRSEVLASRRWPWAVAVTRAGVRVSSDFLQPVPAPAG
jgi:hypothetical protein